jgi:hypothetical protein
MKQVKPEFQFVNFGSRVFVDIMFDSIAGNPCLGGAPRKDRNVSTIQDFKRVKVLRCVGQVARTVRIKKRT